MGYLFLMLLLALASCTENYHRKVVDSDEVAKVLEADTSITANLILDVPDEMPENFNFILRGPLNANITLISNGDWWSLHTNLSKEQSSDDLFVYCYSRIEDKTYTVRKDWYDALKYGGEFKIWYPKGQAHRSVYFSHPNVGQANTGVYPDYIKVQLGPTGR